MLKKTHVFPALASLLLASTSAYAGPLATDVFAMAGFKGTTTFTSTDGKLIVDVDYGVFAPAAQGGAANSSNYSHSGGNDPSDNDLSTSGSRYVYAYQAFVRSASIVALNDVSIGYNGNIATILNLMNDVLHPQTGGTAAGFLQDQHAGGGANSFIPSWVIPVGSGVAPGGFSQVFLFTTTVAPGYATASVDGPGATHGQVSQGLPSPVPEPATLALVGLAGILLRRRGRASN